MGYYEGELNVGNNNGGNGAFGADGLWIIVVLLLFGWGRGGYGGFGGGAGGTGAFDNFELGRLATANDVASGFATNGIVANQNALKLGQQEGFASIQQTLCQGFSGVNQAVTQTGYETQRAVDGVSHQIADCCCSITNNMTQGFANLNYNMAKSTCDIIQANNANTQRLIDYMTSQEISSLRNELSLAQGQLSQAQQTANIVSALKPCPQPAYVVPNPNCCYPNFCGGTTIQ